MSVFYSVHQLINATSGHLMRHGANHGITALVTDTRKIHQADTSVFFALVTDRNDGHRYLKQAIEGGIQTLVVSEPNSVPSDFNGNAIVVADTLRALQQTAANKRSLFALPVIAITGSNGKTIVKEWLNHLLADDFVIARSPRSYNSQLGVPLSVWALDSQHTLGIFEAGISQPDEMLALEAIIQPTIGIITNVREAHKENFSSSLHIAEEKCLLFSRCQKIVYPRDSADIHKALAHERYAQIEKLTWSFEEHPEADWCVRKEVHASGSELVFRHDHFEERFSVPFTDDASLENCVSCIVLLFTLGYTPPTLHERLGRLSPLSMRLELLAGVNNTTVVNDAYSCDLYSLEIAIDFALANAVKKPVSVFLSDLPQTGIAANELFDQLNQLMVEKGIQRWIGVGPQHMQWKGNGAYVYRSFPTTEKLLEALSTDDYQNDCLLIKGARDYRFERVVDCFREQNHETVLEVNLNALTHNLNYFRSQLASSTRLMVMVKAFGYGSGAHEVSSLLQFNQVDYLAVAYTDEGLSLRNHGISLPIMVMNPEHASLGNLIRHHLEPEIFNFRTLQAFLDALSQHDVVDAYPVHIKLDTGMHRLGFEESDIEELVNELRSAKQLRVASVFTHLSSTDNPVHDAFTKKQLDQFSAWSTRIQEALPYPVLRHALNTGGIQRFPEAQFDMVRLGVGLYGVSATPEEQSRLKPVGYLSTTISQIKAIPAGESVGYNRQFIASKDMRIATIPLGYADGLRRAVGNGKGYVWINGQAAPTVGNVCMDMTMIDVSLIHCKEGDRVELFGEHITLLQLANWCDTIPYEILTSISQRVRRIYSQE